jgi:thiamine kinase-like enzyme
VRAAPTRDLVPADTGSGSAVPDALTTTLDRIPALAGAPRDVTVLTGGLTNKNYRIATAERCYVARMPSSHSALLAIDREAEYRNSLAAARSGVAPAVVAYLPADADGLGSLLLIEWVHGRTWSSADVRSEANLARIAASCQALHSGPRFVSDFDMFQTQRDYLSIVRSHGFRLPPRYDEFMPAVAEIREALSRRVQPSVPCHNDLLAENFIDDGERLWLIDYEYAGNNDPYFELGNIASESGLDQEQLEQLVLRYCGKHSPALVARARLWALLSQYGWTLWASIQDAVSELDFDFWSWGMEKYDRAVATFDGAELSRLLVDVQQT